MFIGGPPSKGHRMRKRGENLSQDFIARFPMKRGDHDIVIVWYTWEKKLEKKNQQKGIDRKSIFYTSHRINNYGIARQSWKSIDAEWKMAVFLFYARSSWIKHTLEKKGGIYESFKWTRENIVERSNEDESNRRVLVNPGSGSGTDRCVHGATIDSHFFDCATKRRRWFGPLVYSSSKSGDWFRGERCRRLVARPRTIGKILRS